MSRRRPPKRVRGIAPPRTPAAPGPYELPTWAGATLLGVVLAAGAAVRAWVSLRDDGIYWPDEIYQSLEPAHRLVFGRGLRAWEFVEGGRSWAFPGVVAAIMKLAALVGLDEPREYITAEKLAFVLLAGATAFGTYRLARALGASTLAAISGAALFSLSAMPIYFGGRALSENASAAAVVFGLALVLPRGSGRIEWMAGAALLGVATMFRLQNALFAAGSLAVLLVQQRPRALATATTTLAAVALVFGALDWVTWGAPFKSALVNVRKNIEQAGDPEVMAAVWFVPPPSYYVTSLWSSMGAATIAGVALAVVGARRSIELAALAALYVLAHALVPHKELRFLIPLVPLIGALAALGVDAVASTARTQRWRGPAAAGALVAASIVSGIGVQGLRFVDVGVLLGRDLYDEHGIARKISIDTTAYDVPGPVDRLLIAASALPDVCGLKVEAVRKEYHGGYTYFHRAIPLYRQGGPPRSSGFFNYAIALRTYAGAGEIRASEGDMALVRIGDACKPDPAFNDRL